MFKVHGSLKISIIGALQSFSRKDAHLKYMIDTLKPGAEDITLSQVFKTETDFCRRYIGVFLCFVLMEVWELEE